MVTIQLSREELALVTAALRAYLRDFGHDEAEVLRAVKALIARLPSPSETPPVGEGPLSTVSEL
jgi:hypothetical protein